MIYQLLKRDPIRASVVFCTMAMALGAFAVVFVVRTDSFLPLFFGFLCVVTAVSSNQTTAFLEPLPVTMRQIYLARISAMIVLLWLPVVAVAAVYATAGDGIPFAFIFMAALATPVVLGLQSLPVYGITLPRTAALMLAMAGLSLCFDLAARTSLFVTACLLAGGAIVLKTWSVIPPVKTSAPRWPTLRAPNALRVSRSPWWLFSWRDGLWAGPLFLLNFTGPWTSCLLFIWLIPLQYQERNRWLDPLPISRRLILAAHVWPVLIALVLGIVGSAIGMAGYALPPVFVSAGAAGCGQSDVEPPLALWQIAGQHHAPPTQAPWGESIEPPVIRIYGADAFNPYAVGCRNTRRFFDWQHARAISAWERETRPPVRTLILETGVIWTATLLVTLAVFLKDWRWVRKLPKSLSVIVVTLVAGCYGIILVPLLTPGLRNSIYQPMNLVQGISWALPNNPIAVAFIAAAVPLALYLLLQQVFLKSELSRFPTAHSLGNYT